MSRVTAVVVGLRPGEEPTDPRSGKSTVSDLRASWADIKAGAAARDIWWTLARNDVIGRYRRTVLGPFWLTLQMGVWVLGIGFLYGQLFHMDAQTYVPYVASGILIWSLVSGLTVEGSGVFFASVNYIKSAPLPLSIYSYQAVARQLLLFLHNAVVIVIVLAVTGSHPGWNAIWGIPLVLALALFNGFLLCISLGAATARFRDLYPLTLTAMNLLMFLTPVFWSTKQLDRPAWAVAWNPYAWFVELFRDFLLGESFSWGFLVLIGILTVANIIVTSLFFAKSRRRIPYWV